MGKTNSCYSFYFNNLHKSWRKTKAPAAVTNQEYSQNESLCAVRNLDEYVTQTERWRSGEEQPQLLLIFIYPRKAVDSSTISGWVKSSILLKSGVDTSAFKAHSTRSASTFRAALRGASIEDILKQGSWFSKST